MKLFEVIINIWRFFFPKKGLKVIPADKPLNGSYLKIEPLPELNPMYVQNNGFINPIYLPRKGKFKGYMREKRKSTFNKRKRAA